MFFGTHVEIALIQNRGRYGFFERIVANPNSGVKPSADYFIIDLENDKVYKAVSSP